MGFLILSVTFFLTACQSTSEEETMESAWVEIPVSSDSEEAVSDLKEGLKLVDAGFSPDAYKYFNSAIEKDPDLVSAYVYGAWFAPSSTDFGNKLKALNALEDKANDAEKQLIRMTNGFANGNYGEQHQAGLKLVSLYPESPRAHAYLGFVLEGVDKDAEARAEYQKAVELAPEWTGGHSYLVNSYMFGDPKDLAKAQEHAQKMVEIDPSSSSGQILLGDTYRAQQDLPKALSAYKKAVQLDPDNEVAYSKAGHAQTFMGNYAEARESYNKAMELTENPTGLINFTAFTHLYEGNFDEAMNYLNNAASNLGQMGVSKDAMPGATMGMLNVRSTLAMHHGDVEALDKLNQERPAAARNMAATVGTNASAAFSAADVAYWEGIAEAMKGNYDQAVAKANENREALNDINDPTKLQGYNFMLGYLAIEEGDYDNAIAHFKQTNLDNVYNRYMLAKANELAGNVDEAMSIYEDVAAYNFNNAGYALVRNEVKGKINSTP